MFILFTVILCSTLLTASAIFGDCEYTKKDCMECAMAKCDFDQDGVITPPEVMFIFDRVLTGIARWTALKVTSPDDVFEHCGVPGTGVVTHESFMKSHLCIQYCFEKKLFFGLLCDVLDNVNGPKSRAAEYREFARTFNNPDDYQSSTNGESSFESGDSIGAEF